MTPSTLEEFEEYAYFSNRVDRFFNAANIYGMHHGALKYVHSKLPDRNKLRATLNSGVLDDEIRDFVHACATKLSYMATTNIFSDISDGDSPHYMNISTDMLNFSFYTCYCFQWTLFENFIKKMVQKLVDSEVLSTVVRDEVRKKWGKTKRLLDYIESGAVFGTVLLPRCFQFSAGPSQRKPATTVPSIIFVNYGMISSTV